MKENSREITYKEIRENEEINALIEKGNAVLLALGYTEHSRDVYKRQLQCVPSVPKAA